MTGQTSPPGGAPTAPSFPDLQGRRVLVIVNPRSGQGDSGVREFIWRLQMGGAEVTERELPPPEALTTALHDLHDHDVLVGAGGDGTVSALAYAARDRGVPLLAYPAGTANLIAQNLGLPRDPRELAAIVAAGHSVQVDLGEVEVQGQKSGFAMLAGAGADAAMIRDSEGLKKRFGALAYVISALRQVSPKKTTFHLELDGQPHSFRGIGVMVANFGMANYRLPITSDISPSDGQFTVVLLKAGNILQLVPNLIDSLRVKLRLGEPRFSGNLETRPAREVKVDAEDPFPFQYDGELHVQTTPFTARILPGAVRFLTPEQPADLAT